MAQIQFLNGSTTSDMTVIQKTLSPLNIQLSIWPTQSSVQNLLKKETLLDEEKETVAKAHDIYFNKLKEEEGYQSRDVIVLHPNIPNLNTLLEKFAQIHTHDDDELR